MGGELTALSEARPTVNTVSCALRVKRVHYFSTFYYFFFFFFPVFSVLLSILFLYLRVAYALSILLTYVLLMCNK